MRAGVDPRGLDRRRAAPCGTMRTTIGTPSVVSRSTGLPRPPEPRAPSWLNAPRDLAHRSRLGAAPACVSTYRSVPLGQRRVAELPCSSSSGRDARCVGPTSAFSRSSYQHPRLVGSRCVSRLRAAHSRRSPVSRQSDSLRWVARPSLGHCGGLLVPVAVRADRTSGVPVASPTRALPLARSDPSWKPPRPSPTRSRERCGPSGQSGTPSVWREPSPRDALSSARLRSAPGTAAWPPRSPSSTPFHLPPILADPREAGPPSTRPAANGVTLL